MKNQLLGEQYQLLGEHVDFHIQVLMVVFGEGECFADKGVFLSSHAISLQIGLISLWLMLFLQI